MLDWLKGILGDAYTDEVDQKVSAEIGKHFVAKTDFNTLNETKKGLEEQIADRDQQLEELKKVDASALQAEIDRLQGENKTASEKFEKQVADMKFDYALERALAGAKARNVKAVKALIDAEKLKLDGDQITGLSEQLEQIKKDSGYLFDDAPSIPKLVDGTPGTSAKITKDDLSKMTYTELDAYMKAHPGVEI